MNDDPNEQEARWPRWLAALILLAGAGLRLRQLVAGRSLWLDEASLALNVLPRSFLELTGTLDFEQVAPVPFLWAVKAATLLFGSGERALRLIPFLAGTATPWVVWQSSRKLLGVRWALLPLALAALSPTLIYYSNELKPYSTDALAAALLLWAALRGDIALLIAVGALCVTCSFPAILVVPGALVFVLVRRGLRAAALCAATWGVSFAFSYGWARAHGAGSPYLQLFWKNAFLDPGRPLEALTLLVSAAEQDLIGAPMPGWEALGPIIGLVLGSTGAALLARTRRLPEASLLLFPFVAAPGAAVLHLYPISARTLLFALPLVFVLVAAGLRLLVAQRMGFWIAFGVAILVLPAIVVDAPRLWRPGRREDLRPVVERLADARGKGEPVYIYARTIPAWTYYTTDWHQPETARLAFIREMAGSRGPAFENASSRGHPVAAEGDHLIWNDRSGPELLGLATGAGPDQPKVPDPGWAANEARRIHAAGGTAWLVFSHVVDHADSELARAVESLGGVIDARIVEEGASATHVVWR